MIPILKNVAMLAAGSNHVLALDHKGEVWAWGCDQQFQTGRRAVPRRPWTCFDPAPVGLKNIVSISCGMFHSFAIDDRGGVFAWGLNNYGQTGIHVGTGEPESIISRATRVRSLEKYQIREISGGNHHSVACTTRDELQIWGRCEDAQMGVSLDSLPQDDIVFDGKGKARILLEPTPIPSEFFTISSSPCANYDGTGINAVAVAAGIDNSFAIADDVHAFAWGFSENYQTGLRTHRAVSRPTHVQSEDMADQEIQFAGCGGQFSVLAGPADIGTSG